MAGANVKNRKIGMRTGRLKNHLTFTPHSPERPSRNPNNSLGQFCVAYATWNCPKENLHKQ